MRRPPCLVAIPLATLALLACMPALAQPPRPVLYLQPYGASLPESTLRGVEEALRAFYDVELRRLPLAPLPRKAWYAPRKRWRADVLLDALEARLPPGADRILGLTAEDISTTKGDVYDWGVMGLGRLGGKTCVISMFRANKGVSAARGAQRLAKVAVHEVGHTLGLEHCPNVGCLMEDAKGRAATSDRETDLCATCRAHLRQSGRPAKDGRGAPWRSKMVFMFLLCRRRSTQCLTKRRTTRRRRIAGAPSPASGPRLAVSPHRLRRRRAPIDATSHMAALGRYATSYINTLCADRLSTEAHPQSH